MRNKNAFSGSFLFILSIASSYEKLDNLIQTANSLSVILTDYRKHRFYTIDPNRLEIDPYELESFLDDPDDWFEQNGYFFVSGFSTGSSFSTVLTY